MKKIKLGAEPKKVIALGGLGAFALVLFYMNVLSPSESPSPVQRPTTTAGTPAGGGSTPSSRTPARRITEFRPTLKRAPEDKLDPAKVDPTLKLDILAKLQTVTFTGSGRNIFEFGTAPPPPAPKVERKPEPKIIPQQVAAVPQTPVTPPPPQAPPIPLKFYGYISTPKGATKRGFFLDGDTIVVANEGETIKRRYKVVRIGINNVEIEDTQFSQRQTLRLEEPPGGVG